MLSTSAFLFRFSASASVYSMSSTSSFPESSSEHSSSGRELLNSVGWRADIETGQASADYCQICSTCDYQGQKSSYSTNLVLTLQTEFCGPLQIIILSHLLGLLHGVKWRKGTLLRFSVQIFNIAFSLQLGLLGVKRLEAVYIFDTCNCSIALQCNNTECRCSIIVPFWRQSPAGVTWSLILHAPGGSGPEPAVAPVLPSPDPDCTAGPSPVLPAAAHPLESGSPCSHPWSSPGNPEHLHKIDTSIM